MTFILPSGKKLPLHAEVLEAASECFQALLNNGCKETFTKEISLGLKSEQESAFIALIDYLYTNKIEIDESIAP